MTTTGELEFSPLEDADVEAVISLWDACGLTRPHNNPAADLAFARDKPASAVLVGKAAGEIAAAVMVGHDGHRGTVYYVAVDPAHQNGGLGRYVMEEAEEWLRSRGVWKLNLMMRAENEKVRGFYERLGYEVEDRIVMTRWIDPSKRPGSA